MPHYRVACIAECRCVEGTTPREAAELIHKLILDGSLPLGRFVVTDAYGRDTTVNLLDLPAQGKRESR